MHRADEDRLWFQNNPVDLVRFRLASPGEFTPLYAMGEQPPFFRPSMCRPGAPLHWVAVVDLMRLAGSPLADPDEPTVRLRLRSRHPKLPTAGKGQGGVIGRHCSRLLETLESDQTAIAA